MVELDVSPMIVFRHLDAMEKKIEKVDTALIDKESKIVTFGSMLII